MKVLFVCLGNICRSPLAEAIFVKQLRDHEGLSFIAADSCGTAGYHIGDPPDSRSQQNALRNGVSINHRARQFALKDFKEFDFIITMDKSNHHHILDLATTSGLTHKNIHLMRSFQKQADSLEVPDPYYGGEGGFQQVFDILQESTQGLIDHLAAWTNDNGAV